MKMKPPGRKGRSLIPSGEAQARACLDRGNCETSLAPTAFAPQVKICGLKRPEEASLCAQMGASAIGCVFFPPSPRHVSEEEARDICQALPTSVWSVGVFVNESFSGIMRKIERCGLRAAQLHGQESSELVRKLMGEGVLVIKAIFLNAMPSLSDAESYAPSAYLVECAGGALPGGNAMEWDWSAGSALAPKCPLILAGGLNAGNISHAIEVASPDAVDVSSGVELEPGRKDINKVRDFLQAVSESACSRRLRRIFQ